MNVRLDDGAREELDPSSALKIPVMGISKAAFPSYVAGALGQSANAPLRVAALVPVTMKPGNLARAGI